MKKTLVALAAFAATSAFAQSSVTISGNFDAAYSSLNSQDDTADKKDIVANGSSTSHVKFAGTEDLGGGMKASFVGVHLINPVSGQTGNAAAPYQSGNWFNDEITVGVSGAFGQVRLGAPSAGLYETTAGKSSPFGTALGGGYSSSGINRLLGQTKLGMNQYMGGASENGRVIRAEKSVRFDTPVFNGFSANVTMAPKNANSTTATSNTNGFLDTTVNYANGPLVVAYSQAKITAGANAAAGTTGFNTEAANNTAAFTPAFTATANGLGANADVKYTALAANYTMGNATVYAGMTTGKTTGTSTLRDVSSTNVAVKYAVTPMIDVLANTVKVDDKQASSAKDQSLLGLSAIYKFSKRTSAYATYQKFDTDKSSDTAGQVKQTLVGLRHQF